MMLPTIKDATDCILNRNRPRLLLCFFLAQSAGYLPITTIFLSTHLESFPFSIIYTATSFHPVYLLHYSMFNFVFYFSLYHPSSANSAFIFSPVSLLLIFIFLFLASSLLFIHPSITSWTWEYHLEPSVPFCLIFFLVFPFHRSSSSISS